MIRPVKSLLTLFALAMMGALTLPYSADAAPAEGKKQIVFVHGKASHGYGGHAYGPAFRMLARILNQNVPAVNAVVLQDDADLAALEEADAIICYLSCPVLKNQLVSFGFRSREATRFLIASTEGIEEAEVELLSSIDNWYLTMGDSDIDRPW